MKLAKELIAPIGRELYVVNTGEWRYQRPVTDAMACRNCGTCFVYCPTGSRYQKGDSFETDLDYCKGCGICAHECYANAIAMVPERSAVHE